MDRLRRYDHALSLLIFDIDFFKRINDGYRHHVGDLVLVRIAERVRERVSTVDFPAAGNITISVGVTDPLSSHIVKLIWHQTYACGNPMIDQQHQSLFELANTLLDAILSKRPLADVRTIGDRLLGEVTQPLAIKGARLDFSHASTLGKN